MRSYACRAYVGNSVTRLFLELTCGSFSWVFTLLNATAKSTKAFAVIKPTKHTPFGVHSKELSTLSVGLVKKVLGDVSGGLVHATSIAKKKDDPLNLKTFGAAWSWLRGPEV
jgi:hypothetical protein